MARRHIKRITAPASWMINRKESKFIAMPKGSFKMEMGMPLIAVLKDILKLVETRKEGKQALNGKEILVNGKRRKDEKFMTGLMDILTIKDTGKSYRILLDSNGILRLTPISGQETSIRPCKVTGKRSVKGGKIQISLHDGRTCIGDASHSNGDTVIMSVPEGKIIQHLKLEKGSRAYLIGGSNVGRSGTIEEITGDKVTVKIGDNTAEASRKFVFVIGKDKPLFSV